MRSKHFTASLILLVLFASSGTLSAGPVDVVLVLDRSVSMHSNDPGRDSIEGAKLFSTLLGSDDRLALMTFARDARRLLPLRPLSDDKTLDRVSSLIRQVQMDGIETNFEAALRAAYQEHASQPPDRAAKRILVLFSDGQMNLGGNEATNAARAAILEDLLPRFQAAGIGIHGVAFSPYADLDLLRILSESTGGLAIRADTPEDIYAAFVDLFEQADQPLTVPVVDGEVKVDTNVQTLKLLVKRESSDSSVKLTDPSKRESNADVHQPGVEWHGTANYDQITIQHPQAGSWKITGETREQNAYIESDLDLHTQVPVLAKVEELVEVTSRLTYKGSSVAPDSLKDIAFKATISDETGTLVKEIQLRPEPDLQGAGGDHLGAFRLGKAGTFRVRVDARGPTFQRSKVHFISVVANMHPLSLAPTTNALANTPSTASAPAPASASAEPAPAEAEARKTAMIIVVLGNLGLLVLAGIGVSVWRWHNSCAKSDTTERLDSGSAE